MFSILCPGLPRILQMTFHTSLNLCWECRCLLPPRKEYMTSRCGTFAYKQEGGRWIPPKHSPPKPNRYGSLQAFFASACPPIYNHFVKSCFSILVENDGKKRRSMHVQYRHVCFPSIFNLILSVSTEKDIWTRGPQCLQAFPISILDIVVKYWVSLTPHCGF